MAGYSCGPLPAASRPTDRYDLVAFFVFGACEASVSLLQRQGWPAPFSNPVFYR